MPAPASALPSVPTLYHIPYYCSSIPCNLALELELPETALVIKEITPEHMRHDDAYGQLSPRRVVPTLHLPTGEAIVEVGAIVLYLLEEHDKAGKMHPLPGDARRPRFLQGVVYAVAEGYRATMDLFMLCVADSEEHRMLEQSERDMGKVDAARKKFVQIVVNHLERELKDGFYLGEFSAVDLMFAYLFMCVEYAGVEVFDEGEKVKQWFGEMKKRAAYQKLFMPCEG